MQRYGPNHLLLLLLLLLYRRHPHPLNTLPLALTPRSSPSQRAPCSAARQQRPQGLEAPLSVCFRPAVGPCSQVMLGKMWDRVSENKRSKKFMERKREREVWFVDLLLILIRQYTTSGQFPKLTRSPTFVHTSRPARLTATLDRRTYSSCKLSHVNGRR
jgi:hypothetical protein